MDLMSFGQIWLINLKLNIMLEGIGSNVCTEKPENKAIYTDLESIDSALNSISDSLYSIDNSTDRLVGAEPSCEKDKEKECYPETMFGIISKLRALSGEIADRGVDIAGRLNKLV